MDQADQGGQADVEKVILTVSKAERDQILEDIEAWIDGMHREGYGLGFDNLDEIALLNEVRILLGAKAVPDPLGPHVPYVEPPGGEVPY